jgi:hypothetical protein
VSSGSFLRTPPSQQKSQDDLSTTDGASAVNYMSQQEFSSFIERYKAKVSQGLTDSSGGTIFAFSGNTNPKELTLILEIEEIKNANA